MSRQGYQGDPFSQQVDRVQTAMNAFAPRSVGLPPFTAEWGYAHGTSDAIWPDPSLGGEPASDYVEQVVVYIQGLPTKSAKGDILKAAKILKNKPDSSFGILYVAMPSPGAAYVYCTDYRRAADLADVFNEVGFPADLSSAGSSSKGSSSKSSGSGSGSSGSSGSSSKRGTTGGSRSERLKTVGTTYAQHCHFMISSQFLQHLQDVRGRKGKDSGDKVRREWEQTHPSGKKPRSSKK